MRNVGGGPSQSISYNMFIKSPCIICTYICCICVSVREAMSSYFISSPRGVSDVCMERGRVMTSVLLLFIKMELVHRNAVSRQTVIDIKCRQVHVLCLMVLRMVGSCEF
jgi:hypothetical protein